MPAREELLARLAALPDGDLAALAELASEAPASAHALTLTPEPSPASGDGRVKSSQLEEWSAIYATAHRQIRRWIARGKECGEPCPLDDPEKMPAWIDRHLEKKRRELVDNVQAAADSARAKRIAAAPAASPSSAVTDPSLTSAANATPAATGPLVASFDLSTVGGVEGESVQFFRTIFAAVKVQLASAYKSGIDREIKQLHARLKEVGESLRKHEIAAENRAKRLGEFIDRAEVINDVTQALHTLVQMRERRADRIRADLAEVPSDVVERMIAVHDAASLREEEILRNLAVLKSPDDVSIRLAA